jgi:hypothetical protein
MMNILGIRIFMEKYINNNNKERWETIVYLKNGKIISKKVCI